jgi:anti-sigma factor RsiW
MTCNEAEVLLHALLDGELDAGHAREVEVHVENCPRCATQLRAYRELQQAMPVAQLHFTGRRACAGASRKHSQRRRPSAPRAAAPC